MEVFVARQPIFNKRQEAIGYELLYRSNQADNNYSHSDGNNATVNVIGNSFYIIGIERKTIVDIKGSNKIKFRYYSGTSVHPVSFSKSTSLLMHSKVGKMFCRCSMNPICFTFMSFLSTCRLAGLLATIRRLFMIIS